VGLPARAVEGRLRQGEGEGGKAAGIKGKDAITSSCGASWNAEMQDYCEQDVDVTLALYLHFVPTYIANNFEAEDAIKLEHGVAHIVARQERYGFAFDVA
jgi:DNA polymerase-1